MNTPTLPLTRSNPKKNGCHHVKPKQKHAKKKSIDPLKDIDSYSRNEKLHVLVSLDSKVKKALRKGKHQASKTLSVKDQRLLWRNTQNLSDERQQELEKYLRNAERGRLPMVHDGRNITRPITAEILQKFKDCPECIDGPKVFIPFKREIVGCCTRHWNHLADTVIGWEMVDEKQKVLEAA